VSSPQFGPSTTADEVLAGVDLAGKVAVVTGASSGLGRELLAVLAAHGADVVAAVRNPAKVDGHRTVELDLASLAGVRSAATALAHEVPRIDLLFNNAGVMATPETRTADDFELQLGTNHLGHFLLTTLVASQLSAGARVINTTSLGHMVSGMRWDDPHFRTTPYDKWVAYGQSKTANILFTMGLAERGITAYAAHPGSIDTGLLRHLTTDELAFVAQVSQSEAKTPQQGVATLVWGATATGIPSGSYLADCQIAEPAPHATEPAAIDRLWRWSAQQVRASFDAGSPR